MTARISLQEALLDQAPPPGERSAAGTCFYCRRHATRIEWDHFPMPYEFGGTTVVRACLTCHDLKDRLSIMDWPPEAIREAFEGLTPMAALLVSKVMRTVLSAEVPREDRMEPRR